MVPATQLGLYLHDWAGLGHKNGPRNTGIHVNVGHCPEHVNDSLLHTNMQSLSLFTCISKPASSRIRVEMNSN
jgi:hypothetical protein